MSDVLHVPRIQVVTAHNQKLIAERDDHLSIIRTLREQLRGLNRRNTVLAAKNHVLQNRIRIQLRMLDMYREQGFRRSVLTPLHVELKRTEGARIATNALSPYVTSSGGTMAIVPILELRRALAALAELAGGTE